MPHTVLSVDADAAVRSVRNEALRKAGFDVIDAATGTDALKLASEKQPTLVILAIALPGMDGFAVSKRLKADSRTASIPVLHISNRGQRCGDYPESLESGADAYLEEPLEPPVLIAVATALIRACSAGPVSAARDITARTQVEQALRASEERYRTLFETMTEGFMLCEIICDEAGKPCDFRRLAVNPAFERQTGLTAADVIGRTVLESFPELEPVWFERYGKVALTGEPARFEEWYGPLGRCYEVSAFQTEPGRFGVVFTDITGRKRAEEERQRLAAELSNRVGELQAILDAAPVAIWIAHDPECQEITGNRMADQFYEAGAGENVSANVTAVRRFFQGGRELEPRELPMQEAAARGVDIRNSELDVLLPSGELRNMLGNASPLRDRAGQVRGCVGTFLDITERRRAEEALRESEAVLRSFYDSPGMMRGIVEMIDGGVVHVSCNAAAAEMYGVERESIAGKSLFEAGASEQVARLWTDLYEKSRRTGQPVSMEYARRGADGQEHWLLATATYLGAGRSGLPRFGYTCLDLTDRKRAEEALRESESQLRTVGDNLPEGAIYRYRHDVNGEPHVDFISSGIERLTGVSAAEFMGDAGTVDRNIVPEDLDRMNAAIALSRERLAQFEVEVRHRHRATGELRWSLLRSTPSRCPDGSTVWDGIELDITERKRAEEALRESEAVLRSFFDSPGMMRGFVELVDGGVVHVSCNAAAAEMYGVDRGSIAGKSATEAGAPEEIARSWVDLYEKSRRTGKPVSMEYARHVSGRPGSLAARDRQLPRDRAFREPSIRVHDPRSHRA